jgi:hypothetical protein
MNKVDIRTTVDLIIFFPKLEHQVRLGFYNRVFQVSVKIHGDEHSSPLVSMNMIMKLSRISLQFDHGRAQKSIFNW